jgi:hypothetical protein
MAVRGPLDNKRCRGNGDRGRGKGHASFFLSLNSDQLTFACQAEIARAAAEARQPES